MIIKTIIIAYLIGFFTTYFCFRSKMRKDEKNNGEPYTWEVICDIFWASALWWFIFPSMGILYAFYATQEWITKKKIKPPKWL